jgi:hypothetical protein
MGINIPVTKKHSIKLKIKNRCGFGMCICSPSLEIHCGHRDVTNYYIKTNGNKNILPTAENVKTAIELIHEAEWRIKEIKMDRRTT